MLAHVDRLAAFRLMVKAGPEGLPSGEIADRLAIPPTRMNSHLATLERSGLVASRRDGRRTLYAASYDDMRQLLGFITEDFIEVVRHCPDMLDEFLAAAGQSERLASVSVRTARLALVTSLLALDKLMEDEKQTPG